MHVSSITAMNSNLTQIENGTLLFHIKSEKVTMISETF